MLQYRNFKESDSVSNFVIKKDIKGFKGTIDHETILRTIQFYITKIYIYIYIYCNRTLSPKFLNI